MASFFFPLLILLVKNAIQSDALAFFSAYNRHNEFRKKRDVAFLLFFLLYYNAAVLAKEEHRASVAEDAHRTDGPINAHVFPSNEALIAAFSQVQSIFSRNISVSVLVTETRGEPVLRKFLIADISASVFL